MYLTADDVARLADESGEHWALVLLLAYCGLRWGEAIASRLRDIEFLRRRMSVHTNAVQIGSRHVLDRPRAARIGTAPVPELVCDELSAQRRGQGPLPVTLFSRRPGADICNAQSRPTGGSSAR